jgi:N-acetylneuraminate synthase
MTMSIHQDSNDRTTIDGGVTPAPVRIDGIPVGGDAPAYVIGEIGLNHNGDVELAKRLIDVLEYRYRVEFDREQYIEIGDHATLRGLSWFASPWDEPSVDFLEDLGVSAHKVASASVTDSGLLTRLAATGKPIILSTGMSTLEQIDRAVELLAGSPLVILHATSTYPLPPEEANLRMIDSLAARYPGVPVGYSGHETGLQISLAAVALGAKVVERHITLDRAMWGSDHAASLEPHGFSNLVRDIRVIETAMGDGVKRIFPGELAPLAKLRRVDA